MKKGISKTIPLPIVLYYVQLQDSEKYQLVEGIHIDYFPKEFWLCPPVQKHLNCAYVIFHKFKGGYITGLRSIIKKGIYFGDIKVNKIKSFVLFNCFYNHGIKNVVSIIYPKFYPYKSIERFARLELKKFKVLK